MVEKPESEHENEPPEDDESDHEREHESPEDDEPDEDRDDSSPGGDGSADDADEGDSKNQDVSDITAPSIGPNTKIEKESPQERMARGEQSQTDAMGLDKHREVIGGRYSASPLRQATIYGLVVAVVIGLAFGFKLLADELDQPPKTVADEAPWAAEDAEQRAPDPLQ